MKTTNRDLLVLTKTAITNKKEMDSEVEKLHLLLFHIESIDNFCIANEIIDVVAYKIITNIKTYPNRCRYYLVIVFIKSNLIEQ